MFSGSSEIPGPQECCGKCRHFAHLPTEDKSEAIEGTCQNPEVTSGSPGFGTKSNHVPREALQKAGQPYYVRKIDHGRPVNGRRWTCFSPRLPFKPRD